MRDVSLSDMDPLGNSYLYYVYTVVRHFKIKINLLGLILCNYFMLVSDVFGAFSIMRNYFSLMAKHLNIEAFFFAIIFDRVKNIVDQNVFVVTDSC